MTKKKWPAVLMAGTALALALGGVSVWIKNAAVQTLPGATFHLYPHPFQQGVRLNGPSGAALVVQSGDAAYWRYGAVVVMVLAIVISFVLAKRGSAAGHNLAANDVPRTVTVSDARRWLQGDRT